MSMVSQELASRAKRESAQAEERTEAGTFFSPHTDIHETERAVIVSMEVPGVDKGSIDLQLDKGVLTVKGTVDGTKYEALRPIYSGLTEVRTTFPVPVQGHLGPG